MIWFTGYLNPAEFLYFVTNLVVKILAPTDRTLKRMARIEIFLSLVLQLLLWTSSLTEVSFHNE